MLREDWRNYLVNGEEVDEAYIVFEEDEKGVKTYDLCVGIFNDLEVAKEYADSIHTTEDLFIAKYDDYMNGSYDYLYEVR